MQITFDGKGLEQLAQAIEEAEGLKFRQKLDKKIVTRAAQQYAAPAIQRRVLFHCFPVFLSGSSADKLQFTPCQLGL